jgi:alpha-tubulin suppressor-like RCC1 family protein
MGDNSEEQCAISGRRANEPEITLKDFAVADVHCGQSQNVAVSEENELYSWGGTSNNHSGIQQSAHESKLRIMEDLKRRKVGLISAGYANTIIITGQS